MAALLLVLLLRMLLLVLLLVPSKNYLNMGGTKQFIKSFTNQTQDNLLWIRLENKLEMLALLLTLC